MASKKDDRKRQYRRMTFAQVQKRWMKTSVGERRGPLKPDTDRLELALNLMSFDIGARLEIIRELVRKTRVTSEAKAKIGNQYKELKKETDFLHKAGLYLIDSNRP